MAVATRTPAQTIKSLTTIDGDVVPTGSKVKIVHDSGDTYYLATMEGVRCSSFNSLASVKRQAESGGVVVQSTVAYKEAGSISKTGFFKAISRKHKDHAEIHKFYSPVEKAALNENSGLQGGYLVPYDYTLALYRSLEGSSILWPRAFVWPMTTLECLCPRVNLETAQSAGTAPYFGGMLFSWGPAQGSNLTETEPVNGLLTLKANDLTGYLITSNQLWTDIGPEGEEAVIDLCGKAAGWYAEYAFFNGTGTANKQPLGILNSPALLTINRVTTGHLTQQDAANLSGKLMPYCWSNAIFVCSPSAYVDVANMANFQPNENVHNLEAGCAGILNGRPLYVSDKLPALGTKGDLLLLDPSLYAIGNRQEALVDVSDHYLFSTFQTVLRVTLRADGRPVLDSTITLADGTTTASAFVALNA